MADTSQQTTVPQLTTGGLQLNQISSAVPSIASALPQLQTLPAEHLGVNPLPPEWFNAEYRRAYMVASIEQGIAWQIRMNRLARSMSQEELASLIGSRQSAVSRLEDPSYGRYSIDSLIKIANVFDCALSVRFVPYSTLAAESADLSPQALTATSFAQETGTGEPHGA